MDDGLQKEDKFYIFNGLQRQKQIVAKYFVKMKHLFTRIMFQKGIKKGFFAMRIK